MHWRLGLILASVLTTIALLASRFLGGAPAQAGPLGAPLGTAFTYQGQIKLATVPVNGTCDFQFSLYDAPSGAALVVGPVAANGVAVANGLFTTTLDFGAGAFNGDARWLEIAANCPGGGGGFTTLAQRQALTPTPYALFAQAAASATTLLGALAGDVTGTQGATSVVRVRGVPVSSTAPQGGQVLRYNAATSQWEPSVDGTGADWTLAGNAGTTPGTNFLGTTDNVALELKVNGQRALRLEPSATSPNVVGGYSGNTTPAPVVGATVAGGGANAATNRVTDNYGTVGGGADNQAGNAAGPGTDRTHATVAGGSQNLASGQYAATGGGIGNQATASGATVGGGDHNQATATGATAGGGQNNAASADHATVGGGTHNQASGFRATVGGGGYNQAAAFFATVGGGGSFDLATANRVTDEWGTVGGGFNNQAGNGGAPDDNTFATVGGGHSNLASGQQATVGGGIMNQASQLGATVAGGDSNAASGQSSAVGGGQGNVASASNTTIGGGGLNKATRANATVAGGAFNQAGGDVGGPPDGSYAAVGGGQTNVASGSHSAVGGGNTNTASGLLATVAGGNSNTASETWATAGGGDSNTASGTAATIPGGSNNRAQGTYSLAAGQRAKADHQGTYVWADASPADLVSTASNQFIVRAAGGLWLGTTSAVPGTGMVPNGRFVDTSTGGYLSTAGVWTDVSDREAKTDFAPVDRQALLQQVAALPVGTWRYKADASDVRHLGPVAQDFHATFGLGDSDKHLAALDTSGVALAAVQGLYELVQERDAEVSALRQQGAVQQAQLAALELRLAALERADAGEPAASGAAWPLVGFLGLVLAGAVVGPRYRASRRP